MDSTVYGYSLSSSTWDKVLGMMPVQYRSYAIDLRGFGDSGKPDTGYTYRDMAEDIAQFLDATKIEKAVLVGHSLGGNILQHFAVLYPDRILALVLTNSFAMNMPPKGMSESVQKRIDGYGSKQENRQVFTKTMPFYFDASNISPGDLEKFVESGLKASNNALKDLLKETYTIPPIPAEKFNA
ncbi:MAG: alpha/beta fold hydrolase, partial [Chloroflexota bacterium]